MDEKNNSRGYDIIKKQNGKRNQLIGRDSSRIEER